MPVFNRFQPLQVRDEALAARVRALAARGGVRISDVYEMDMSRIKALDMTDPVTAQQYGVNEAFAHEHAVEAEVAAERAKGALSPEKIKELDELTKMKYAKFQAIGVQAKAEGYNAVKFPSVRGDGYNYVIYSKDAGFMNQVMQPPMVMPAVK